MPRQINIEDEIGSLLAQEMLKQMDSRIMKDVEIARFFDELQAHIVIAGGAKISVERLKQMSLDSLTQMLWPNDINLVVKNKRFKDNR